jgi:hypothetical protein
MKKGKLIIFPTWKGVQHKNILFFCPAKQLIVTFIYNEVNTTYRAQYKNRDRLLEKTIPVV